jgi:PPOX class probable F420-dependent enzyme
VPLKLTREDWERFLRGRHVAVLATTALDGTAVLTPIWYLYKDGLVLMRTDANSIKALNMAREPRVTVCVQEERPPYKSVTVYGNAQIEDERPELGKEMSRHYLGAVGGAAYMRLAAGEVERGEEVTIIITPSRVLTQDFSLETPRIGRVWLQIKRVLPPWL